MRYIIADEEFGVFLGTYNNPSPEEKSRLYPIFSKINMFDIYKAPTFEKESDAQRYIDDFLYKMGSKLRVLSVDTKEKYVCVSKIIKAGHERYTYDMMDGMPMVNDYIH